MRYLLLVVTLTFLAWDIHAQQLKIDSRVLHHHFAEKRAAGAAKTTSVPPRWYNYGEALDTSLKYDYRFGGVDLDTVVAVTIWNDTNGIVMDTNHVYHHVILQGEAELLNPQCKLFNHNTDSAYIGQMYISDTDAYEIDSVEIFGVYQYNSAKTTEVDTLRLAFLTGNGQYNYDNFALDTAGTKLKGPALGVHYDTARNVATGVNAANLCPATTLHTLDVLLDNTTWNDTLPGGIWHRTIAINGAAGMKDSADFFAAMSITYISGDVATHTGALSSPSPGDTITDVWKGWGNSKYNTWSPLVEYYTFNGAPDWPTYYFPTDTNEGAWVSARDYGFGNWRQLYAPMYAWGLTTPSILQYPYISWYVSSCATCGLVMQPLTHSTASGSVSIINSVTAYPDPVINELSIAFTITYATDVSITLTNATGQEVAIKKINNASGGRAIFNTVGLPAGIYVYTLSANGTNSSGRVVVTH